MSKSLIALSLLATPGAAYACGGFFCNNVPIDQSAEQIVFGVDSEAGTVEMHTRIFYQGAAEEFAWVVPVADNPELFLSSEQLFMNLGWQTQPYFWMDYHFDDDCTDGGYYYGPETEEDAAADFSDSASAGGGDEVIVVSQQQVGPYDTVVLLATDTSALLDWLQDNGYDLPDRFADVLAPYVAEGSHFVALKLANDQDTGDIAPLGLRFKGDKASIPIQLTSISATPDMRLEVWMFGDERAVPESYLHVQINEAAIDWFSYGSNYNDVITQAADEAGGHAFATDFAGSPSEFKGQLWTEDRYNLDYLRTLDHPVSYVDELLSEGFQGTAALLAIFQENIPMPAELAAQGVDERSFYNCLDCYDVDWSEVPFDPVAMTADIEERIVEPLENAEKLYDHAKLSRMTSSVSPAEMTVDPVFVLNPDMGDVSNEHKADLTFACEPGQSAQDAVRVLDLQSGEQILFPPQSWFWQQGESESDYLSDIAEVAAVTIEQTSASGEPNVIFDYTEQLGENIDVNNEDVRDEFEPSKSAKGCGCDSGSAPVGLLAGLLGALALRLRREV